MPRGSFVVLRVGVASPDDGARAAAPRVRRSRLVRMTQHASSARAMVEAIKMGNKRSDLASLLTLPSPDRDGGGDGGGGGGGGLGDG